MNERQTDLLNLLKANSDRWFKQEEIARILSNHYGEIDSSKNFHDTRARAVMTVDIRHINDTDEVPNIIITNGNGVKLATREEFEQYITNQYASVFRKLVRTNKKARKANLDGQLKFDFFNAELNQIDAFVDSCVGG